MVWMISWRDYLPIVPTPFRPGQTLPADGALAASSFGQVAVAKASV